MLFRRIPLLHRQQIHLHSNRTTAMSQPASVQHKLCMIPGPIEFHEDVLTAMATPGTSHVDPQFINMFGESLEMLRKVVLTTSAQPFILSGSGTLGWDSVLCNLMEPGEEVLVVNTGYFGDRFAECASTYGFVPTHCKAPAIGDRPSLEAIGKALTDKLASEANRPYKLINITHVDTSTGVLTDIKSIAEIVRQKSPQTLISVDGVCSIGGEELRMDEWGVDAVMTASQKALGCPSGLCVFWASQKAIETFKARKTPVNNYFASWSNWLPIMNAYESRKPSYFATPAVSLIIALHASLKQFAGGGDESMLTRFKAHEEASRKLKDKLLRWGLRLVPVERDLAANTLTAVYYPDGVQATDLLPKIVKQGVVVAGGLHRDIASKYFRIGHMGISAVEPERHHIDKVIESIRQALLACGYQKASQ